LYLILLTRPLLCRLCLRLRRHPNIKGLTPQEGLGNLPPRKVFGRSGASGRKPSVAAGAGFVGATSVQVRRQGQQHRTSAIRRNLVVQSDETDIDADDIETVEQKPKPGKKNIYAPVFWKDFAIKYLKGKHFYVARLRDPNKPLKN
jgi:hypothetical protein